jgi:glycosyltransferase involved in cell wall biosynthesis
VHVVHLIARLNDGGPVRVLAALVPALAAHGIRCTVFCGQVAADERDASDILRTANIAVETIPALGRGLSCIRDMRAWSAIRSRLRTVRPDLLHTHTAKAGVLGRLAARSLGIPVLHTYHGHVLSGYFSPAATAVVRMVERVCARGSALHALTPSQAAELARHHRIGRPHRWHVLPMPVQIPQRLAKSASAPPTLGFLGRLVPVKDPHLWLDVFAALARRHAVRGRICGDGPLRDEIAARIRAESLAVELTGFVPPAVALAGMDALLLTSRNEGLPVAAIEAAGLDIPVCATAVGGLRDLARQGALRVAPRRVAALVALVEQALFQPCDPLPARGVAEALAPAALAPRYADLYRSVYARHARAHGAVSVCPDRPHGGSGSAQPE